MRTMRLLALGIAVFSANHLATAAQRPAPAKSPSEKSELEAKRLQDERRQFQLQELTTARPGTWIFNPGDPPRIIWRDVEEVRRLGWKEPLRVRWFDAKLHEAAAPNTPGRWGAWIEGTAPNGTPFHRELSFYARPKNFFIYLAPELHVTLPPFPGPIAAEVWREHQQEHSRLGRDLPIRAINDSEAGAILMAGLAECKPLGRPAREVESAAVLNEDFQLSLKLKVQGLHPRGLKPPRRRSAPATVLHAGTPLEADI